MHATQQCPSHREAFATTGIIFYKHAAQHANLHKLGEGLFHHLLVSQGICAQNQVERSLWVRLGIQHSNHGLHCVLQDTSSIAQTAHMQGHRRHACAKKRKGKSTLSSIKAGASEPRSSPGLCLQSQVTKAALYGLHTCKATDAMFVQRKERKSLCCQASKRELLNPEPARGCVCNHKCPRCRPCTAGNYKSKSMAEDLLSLDHCITQLVAVRLSQNRLYGTVS